MSLFFLLLSILLTTTHRARARKRRRAPDRARGALRRAERAVFLFLFEEMEEKKGASFSVRNAVARSTECGVGWNAVLSISCPHSYSAREVIFGRHHRSTKKTKGKAFSVFKVAREMKKKAFRKSRLAVRLARKRGAKSIEMHPLLFLLLPSFLYLFGDEARVVSEGGRES